MGDLLRLLLEGKLVEGLGLRLLDFITVWGCGDSGLKHTLCGSEVLDFRDARNWNQGNNHRPK